MRKLYAILSALAFSLAYVAGSTHQPWMTAAFFGFIGAVFLILSLRGDKP